MLDGPRGVGKTTSALRLVRSTVELPRDLERMRIDAEAFLAGLPTPVLIDEWQIAGTDLLWTLKWLVDADPTPGRFILTAVSNQRRDDLLERTHLAVPSQAFESNRLERLTTYPKRFLADTALALALAGLDAARLVDDPTLAGPYVESSVVQ